MPAAKIKKTASTHQLLVARIDTFQFEIEAKSAEDDCRKLQRNLKAGDESYNGKPSFVSWSDPAKR